MMKRKLVYSLILAALAAPGLAMAADAPAAPTLSSILDASGISLTGDIDFSYTSLSGTGQFTSGTSNRVFDANHNSFNLQAVDVAVSKLPAEGFGGVVEVTLGKDAGVIASSGTVVPNQTYDLTQSYIQYATGPWAVIAGKFATDTGAEVIKTSGNTNFSRSILFGYAIPFTHTGMRATYKVSDAVSLTGGVNNGWDEVVDMHSGKTVELGAVITPSKSFSLSMMDHNGVEQVAFGAAGLQGTRNLLDLVATITVSDNLNFVLNYDNGSQGNSTLASGAAGTATWSGLAGYANYQINDPWRVSMRAESFNDTDGYRTGVVQTWKELTLTVGYAPTKSTELRGEVRNDTSDQAAFAYNDGIARKSQSSLGLEAIYKF